MSTPATTAVDKLNKLRADYVNQLPAQLEQTRKAFTELAQDAPAAQGLEELHRQLHTLKGACASFGLNALSVVAGEGEQLAKLAMKGEAAPDGTWRKQLEDCFEGIAREIAGIDISQEHSPQAAEASAASEAHQENEQKLVYLCEDDPFQCHNLATQIGCFGFKVVAFEKLEDFQKTVRETRPDVIVMDMIHPARQTGGADIIKEILAECEIKPPVVFISTNNEMPSRLAAVRSGSSAYFVKPVNATELSATLHALTSAEAPEPYRVMIIDDDSNLLKVHSTILREAGMVTKTLSDPLLALPRLYDFKPDLILMDMHMPGCNGIELSRVIRQIDAHISIPIVFLSSETDEGVQCDARSMGGDEFLTKPIKPEHLVSAVGSRAGRMKLIRSFMTKDGMTGLFNHSATKEYLNRSVELAMRSGEDLCFAMIDLDHFKAVNDTYGHPVGDQVIVALASLLKQRLRKSDVIGRYGGEEFAVILPGSSIEEAALLLDNLRNDFANVSFPVKNAQFSAAFSCGVAQLRDTKSADALCAGADKALYTAKREGRNRTVALGYQLPQINLSGVSILVVEDAPPIRAILTHMLQALGCNTFSEAANGQEALEALMKRPIDIIIADWHMPIMDGLALLKAVRADARVSKIPFLMVSGEGDFSAVKQAILAGVSDYILKPVSTAKLSNKLARLLP
jgi:diguanylate cyclase (GGDEF)-like protein